MESKEIEESDEQLPVGSEAVGYMDVSNENKAFELWWGQEYRNNYLADKAFIKKAWLSGVAWCDQQIRL